MDYPGLGLKKGFRIILPLFAAFILLLSIASWLILAETKKQIQHSVKENLQANLRASHGLINAWLDERFDDVGILLDHQDVKLLVAQLLDSYAKGEDIINSPAQESLRNHFKPWLDHFGTKDYFISGSSGSNISSSFNHDIGMANPVFEQDQYFARTLYGNSQFVLPFKLEDGSSKLESDFAIGEPVMFILMPIYSPDGEIQAVFGARLDPLDDFSSLAKSVRSGETGDGYCFNKDGKFLSEGRFVDDLRALGLLPPLGRSILELSVTDPGGNMMAGFKPKIPRAQMSLTRSAESAVKGESGFDLSGYRDYRGVLVVGAWTWDKKYNFGLTNEIEVSEAYHPYFTIRYVIFIALFFIIILFLVALFINENVRKKVIDAGEKLAQYEEKIEVLTDFVHDALIIFDGQTRIKFWSRGAELLFGFGQDEVMNRYFHELIAPEHRRGDTYMGIEYFIRFEKGIVDGVRGEVMALKKGGIQFNADISINGIRKKDEWWAVGAIRDITSRKQVEHALLDNEARLREVQEIVNLGYWELDIPAEELKCSDTTYRIYGLSPQEQEATSTMFLELIHPEDREKVKKAYQESLANRSEYNIQHRLLLKDGTLKYVSNRCKTEYDKDGNPLRSLGTVLDITQLKQNEFKLSQLMERFELAAKAANVGVFDWDIKNNITIWDNSMYRLYGVNKEDFAGGYEAWEAYVHPDDLESVLIKLEVALGGESPFDTVFRIQNESNKIKYIKADAIIYRDDNGKAIRMIGTNYDITKRMEIEIELKMLNEKLEQRVYARTKELDKSRIAAMSIMQDANQQRVRAEEALLELEQSQKKIAENEERFRDLVESTYDVIWEHDGDGVLTYISPSVKEVLGFNQDEVVGRPGMDLVVSTDADMCRRAFDECAAGGKSIRSFEYRHIHKDGKSIVYIEANVTPVFQNGSFAGFRGVSRDITERKKSDEALRKLFRAIEASPVSVVITDSLGSIEYINQKFTGVTGYTLEEVIGQNPNILKSGEQTNDFYKELWGTITQGQQWQGEICNKKKDGLFFWERVSISPIFDRDGSITHFVGVGEDVTEQRNTRESLELTQFSVDWAADPIFWVLADGRIAYGNTQACRALGYTPEELSCLKLSDFDMSPEFRDEGFQWSVNEVRQRESKTFEGVFRKKTGESFPVELTMTQRVFGKKEYLFASAKDITYRKKAEKELQDALTRAEGATRAKSLFLASMSHDIRTPMNGVLGMLELLSLSTLDQKQKRTVNTITDSAQALLQILNDILDFSKIEADKLQLLHEDINLTDLVESVVGLMVNNAHEKGLQVHLFISPLLSSKLSCDGTRIRQILFNLLSNAIKFTSEGFVSLEVYVGTTARGRQSISVEIVDSGIGISEANQKRLFAPFTQAEQSTTRRFGGTGLGLAICRRLINLMEGEISIKSEAGQGTTVTVSLELAVVSGPDPHEAFTGKKVLILEGDYDREEEFLIQYFKNWGMIIASIAKCTIGILRDTVLQVSPDLIVIWENEIERFGGYQEFLSVLGGSAPATVVLTPSRPDLSGNILKTDQYIQITTNPLQRTFLQLAIRLALGLDKAEDVLPGVNRNKERRRFEAIWKGETRLQKILVVEDHPTNQQLILNQLEILGLPCDLAEDGQKGLSLWETMGYTLILSDIHMPVMNGYDFAHSVREEEKIKGGHIPMIALTANALAGEADKCKKAGMDDFLSKPATIEQLRAKLIKWLPLTVPQSIELSNTVQVETEDGETSPFSSLFQAFKDKNKVLSLLDQYKKTNDADVEKLRLCLAEEDSGQLKKIAHRIKGAAGYVGASDLESVSFELEKACKTNQWSAVETLVPRFWSALAHVDQAIKELETEKET